MTTPREIYAERLAQQLQFVRQFFDESTPDEVILQLLVNVPTIKDEAHKAELDQAKYDYDAMQEQFRVELEQVLYESEQMGDFDSFLTQLTTRAEKIEKGRRNGRAVSKAQAYIDNWSSGPAEVVAAYSDITQVFSKTLRAGISTGETMASQMTPEEISRELAVLTQAEYPTPAVLAFLKALANDG